MNELHRALQEVRIGDESVVRNLSLFPLLTECSHESDYVVLADAIRAGSVRIKETSEGGTVPKLTLINRADQPVLLIDGEQLIGCKQNRILNLTILAPAHGELMIPVSCVEQGRWRYDSSQFDASKQCLYAGLRAKKTAQVSRNLESLGAPFAAQDEMWADLAVKAERLGSSSSTAAMAGIFERRESEVRTYTSAASWTPSQVGALFAINGRFVGIELFDSDGTCRKYLEKIASSYALDAIDYFTPVYPIATVVEAQRFLEHMAAAPQARFESVGLGEDVRIADHDFAGAALAVDDRVVHFCGFDLCVDMSADFARRSDRTVSIRRSRFGCRA